MTKLECLFEIYSEYFSFINTFTKNSSQPCLLTKPWTMKTDCRGKTTKTTFIDFMEEFPEQMKVVLILSLSLKKPLKAALLFFCLFCAHPWPAANVDTYESLTFCSNREACWLVSVHVCVFVCACLITAHNESGSAVKKLRSRSLEFLRGGKIIMALSVHQAHHPRSLLISKGNPS